MMALREALEAILDRWDEISLRLEDDEIVSLAQTLSNAQSAEPDVLLTIFTTVASALEREDPAWELLLQSSTRRAASYRHAEGSLAQQLQSKVSATYERVRRDELSGEGRLHERVGSQLLELERAEIGVLPTRTMKLDIGGVTVVPSFQFASTEPPTLFTVVADLSESLEAQTDPRGAVMWWTTHNPWCRAAPAELLGQGRDEEIGFAAQQLANDSF